jgi:hypothetical protein
MKYIFQGTPQLSLHFSLKPMTSRTKITRKRVADDAMAQRAFLLGLSICSTTAAVLPRCKYGCVLLLRVSFVALVCLAGKGAAGVPVAVVAAFAAVELLLVSGCGCGWFQAIAGASGGCVVAASTVGFCVTPTDWLFLDDLDLFLDFFA